MAERSGTWKGSLRLPPDVKAVVKREAAAVGFSMNQWMVRTLEERLFRLEAEEGVVALKPARTSKR
jgi:predicted HicB family RNase H-like nuclease